MAKFSHRALDELESTELKELALELLNEVSELKQTEAELRDENARIKGLAQRPHLKKPGKPSGM